MVKKLGLLGLVFLSLQMYGMQKEPFRWPSSVEKEHYHSTEARDCTAEMDGLNKHYFRLKKLEFIKFIEKSTGLFSQELAPTFANKKTRQWMQAVENTQKQIELERDAQEDARRRALERFYWEQKQREKEKAVREQFLKPSSIFTPSAHILQSR
jgi:hypothetical protein